MGEITQAGFYFKKPEEATQIPENSDDTLQP